MMKQHPTSKSTSALALMSEVTGTIFATQDVSSSTSDERPNVEPELGVKKEAASGAGIKTDITTLAQLSSL